MKQKRIEKNFPDVKHCMVHVNPESKEQIATQIKTN